MTSDPKKRITDRPKAWYEVRSVGPNGETFRQRLPAHSAWDARQRATKGAGFMPILTIKIRKRTS